MHELYHLVDAADGRRFGSEYHFCISIRFIYATDQLHFAARNIAYLLSAVRDLALSRGCRSSEEDESPDALSISELRGVYAATRPFYSTDNCMGDSYGIFSYGACTDGITDSFC